MQTVDCGEARNSDDSLGKLASEVVVLEGGGGFLGGDNVLYQFLA